MKLRDATALEARLALLRKTHQLVQQDNHGDDDDDEEDPTPWQRGPLAVKRTYICLLTKPSTVLDQRLVASANIAV